MKYIVYVTINKVNLKIYVGVHGTEDPNVWDHYLGNGSYDNKPSSYQKGKELFHAAIRKYGVSSFYRITLCVFDTEKEALDLEALIVNEDFIKRTDTYNVTLGGGKPPILSKKVYQFDKSGRLVKEWDSQVKVRNFYKCSKDVIYNCINTKRDFENSYWSFEPIINIEEYRQSVNPYVVYQYNNDGVLLKTFKNVKEAAQKLDLNKNSILGAICEHSKLNGCFFLKESDNISLILSERISKKSRTGKPVYRYKINGEFDCEFESQSDACRKCSLRIGSLSSAIKHNRIYHGYKWSYEKNAFYKSYQELKPVKVVQYDLNHNLIKVYNSVAECSKEFPYAQKVCRKERKSTQGFIFEYIS